MAFNLMSLEKPAEASAVVATEPTGGVVTDDLDTTDFSAEELEELKGLDQEKRSKYIPRSRFDKMLAEVNALKSKAERAERYEELLEEVESQGYMDTAAFKEAVLKNQEQGFENIRKQKEAAAVTTYNSRLKDGYDQAILYNEYLTEIRAISAERDEAVSKIRMDYARQLQGKTGGKSITAIVKGLTSPDKYPDADPETLKLLANNGMKLDKLTAEAKRQQERHDQAIAKYAGNKEKQKSAPTPSSGGGSAGTPPSGYLPIPNGIDKTDPKEAKRLTDHNLAVWKQAQSGKP